MICSPNEQFECQTNECISWSFVCDGIAHCSNKADEDCDMCTNDLYQCKDLSRINCTRACTTLGYIPCKNYMDTKICASVVKSLQSKLNGAKFDKGAGYVDKHNSGNNNDPRQPVLSSSFLENIRNMNRKLNENNNNNLQTSSSSFFNSETVLFSMIGLFFVVSLVVFLIAFGVFYNRFRRAKKRMPLRNTSSPIDNHQIVVNGPDGLLTYPLSSSASFSYPGSPIPKINETVGEDNSVLIKTSSIPNEIYFHNHQPRPYVKSMTQGPANVKEYPRSKRHSKQRHHQQNSSSSTALSQINAAVSGFDEYQPDNVDLFKANNNAATLSRLTNDMTAESNSNMIRFDSVGLADVEVKSTDLIDMDDFQMYSEPPPPYKLSKYFPKVDLSTLTTETPRPRPAPQLGDDAACRPTKKSLSTRSEPAAEDTGHLYENLDDLENFTSDSHHHQHPHSYHYPNQHHTMNSTMSSSSSSSTTGSRAPKNARNPLRKSHKSTGSSHTGRSHRSSQS